MQTQEQSRDHGQLNRRAATDDATGWRVERFAAYAMAFEQVLASDDWRQLDEFFTADAEREVVGGGPLAVHSIGRAAVIADLRRGVDELDRRFDVRLPAITSGPTERDGLVWIDWRLTLQRQGVPDLVVEGTHGTSFEGDRITRIDEALTNRTTEQIVAYLREYGDRLRPAPPTPAAARSHAPLSPARMRALVEGYAAAKSRADADAALAFCHPSFIIETIPFGVASRDRAETALHLAAFFSAFPDYSVGLEGMAFGAVSLACWGAARLTLSGEGFGIAPTGRTASLPVFCVFTFADGLLASERFFFDLAALCDGIGVPLPLMRQSLAQLRAVQESLAAAG